MKIIMRSDDPHGNTGFTGTVWGQILKNNTHKKRKKTMTASLQTNASTSLPVVEFEYPSSTDGKMKLRYLRVVSANSDYIEGYELDNPGSMKNGQFKKFCRNRLVRNGVSLVSF